MSALAFTGNTMSDDLISRAEEFFYFDDELPNKLQAWAKGRCSTFTDDKHQEHPLEHHTLFEGKKG